MAKKKGNPNSKRAQKNARAMIENDSFTDPTGELGETYIEDTGKKLVVGYTDYNVPMFDGADYEVKYTLGASDREKLKKALQADGYKGSLEEMILQHFGECLAEDSFSEYCKDRGIRYDLFTWTS